MVYPGAHSNVGGGYQPGEGARSAHYGEMLSLVPLRAMHAAARDAGVPLLSLGEMSLRSTTLKRSFALDDEGGRKYGELVDHWRHYLAQAGSGGRHVGLEILNHLMWFNRWRFYNIRRNQAAASAGGQGQDAATAAQRESGFVAERASMQRDLAPLQRESETADTRMRRAEEKLRSAQILRARTGLPVSASIEREAAEAREEAARAKDRWLAEKAKLDTYADDSGLGGNFAVYDERLIEDARTIVDLRRSDPSLRLRPHYENLVAAYEDEFVHNRGLRDTKVIAFFERYVHDSLSGFATDATLPSDPRVVYVGGDDKLRFAGVLEQESPKSRAA